MGSEAEERVEKAVHRVRNEINETLTGDRSGERYQMPSDDTEQEIRQEAERAVSRLPSKVSFSQQTGPSGNVYKVPGTTQTYYQASAPGEPPASRLGYLRSTIGWFVERNQGILGKGLEIRGTIGSPMPYSPFLEFGTSKMKKRPFFYPSFKKARRDVRRILGGRKWF